jgi:hypothetical protein
MAAENDKDLTRVVFRMHAELNEVKSTTAGRPIYDEYEVCEISFPANKHTVGVFPATEYAGWGDDPVTGQRTRITYAQKYNQQYLAFKSGSAQSLGGTPLEELTFLTQGKRLELKALNIHTAETLAALDGAQLKMLGMGGRELKNQAQTYIDAANKTADAAHLKNELASRDDEIAKLRREMDAMKTGAPVPPPKPSTDSPFKDFETEDVANWIKDAKPDAVVDGLERDPMIAMADEILAEQGKLKTKKAA